jgi:hypothetical protein
MIKPEGWRDGQMIFNFLEFCKKEGVSGNQNDRLADTFFLSDDEYNKLWNAFCKKEGAI